MSSFPQLPVADCPQLPVAERTSAEELQLIFEVESLQMQLSKAGHPVNARIEEIFIQSVTPNTPLTERIRNWKARRDHLQKMLHAVGAWVYHYVEQIIRCTGTHTRLQMPRL